MIRIDEIYNNTFWPWLDKNRTGTRLFFCDPPGCASPDALFNHGRDDIVETNYVFFHDQEPIHLDIFKPLFVEVFARNIDLYGGIPVDSDMIWPSEQYRQEFEDHLKITFTDNVSFFKKRPELIKQFFLANKKFKRTGHVVVSERGEYVDQLVDLYGWQSHYYFYHGWACQDWYRGYDKTFLIARARDRAPTKTFISPNRIVAGKRDHRVLFLYNVFKNKLDHNWISAPRVCPYENVDISIIARKYSNIYSDIEQVFAQAELPKLFPGEETQIMSSCWLTNFNECADSLVYVPTETVYFGRRLHITEKTFRAIALEMPFVLMAPAGSLEYMRSYGFKTFDSIFSEAYDTELDDIKRVEKVVQLLKDLDNLTTAERQQIHRACLPIVEHNYNHFFNGGLTDQLWPELINMLEGINV